jgi:Domain of unknown function (DUF6532)
VLSDKNGKRKGIYNHPIIKKAVNKMWFMNKRDEGINFQDYFNLLSIPSIVLILTTLRIFFLVINYVKFIFSYIVSRLNATLMSGLRASRPI